MKSIKRKFGFTVNNWHDSTRLFMFSYFLHVTSIISIDFTKNDENIQVFFWQNELCLCPSEIIKYANDKKMRESNQFNKRTYHLYDWIEKRLSYSIEIIEHKDNENIWLESTLFHSFIGMSFLGQFILIWTVKTHFMDESINNFALSLWIRWF